MSTVSQRNFSGGELTPELHSRVDLTKYHSGLATCRNMVVQRYGGVSNRPGTVYIGEGKYDGFKIRLIEFIFSREQTYILEFGHSYIRFIQGRTPYDNRTNILGYPRQDKKTPWSFTVPWHCVGAKDV